MDPLHTLANLPDVDGVPLAAVAFEALPLAASVVTAVRDEDGTIVDFAIEYSNVAAAGGAGDRTATYGKRLFDLLPAFREAGLHERFADVVQSGEAYSQDDVHLTGSYEGIDFDVVLEVVAIPLGGDRVLSVSHDRTAEHSARSRLTSVQETMSQRARIEGQIRSVNEGLIEDLVNVQRALDDHDPALARRHAVAGAARAAELVIDLRSAAMSAT